MMPLIGSFSIGGSINGHMSIRRAEADGLSNHVSPHSDRMSKKAFIAAQELIFVSLQLCECLDVWPCRSSSKLRTSEGVASKPSIFYGLKMWVRVRDRQWISSAVLVISPSFERYLVG